jgi:hypothetical protein
MTAELVKMDKIVEGDSLNNDAPSTSGVDLAAAQSIVPVAHWIAR